VSTGTKLAEIKSVKP